MTATDGSLVRMGEGFTHPRAYGTFPRKLRRYVLEKQVVDLTAAIRSMTSLPATVLRMRDRGVLRAGAMADIVVFDLERVRDLATYQQPHQLAEGMVHVLVGGRFAVQGRPGRDRAARHGTRPAQLNGAVRRARHRFIASAPRPLLRRAPGGPVYARRAGS